MNTLTDLRRTLDQHADEIVDPAAVARTAAVHHRVAVVRRRRRAVGTGAVAAVVLAGVAGLVVPRSHDDAAPAGPVVLGQHAPASLRSLGYTYDATGTSQVIHGRGVVDVKETDRPQLLSWTTDGPATVTFVTVNHEVERTQVTGFRDFLLLPSGLAQKVRVSTDGADVGVATYALDRDAAPAGYTKAGSTFRDRVAGADLLAARIGDLGASSVSTAFVPASRTTSFAVMCQGLPKGDAINLSVNGHGAISSTGCGAGDGFDPGTAPYSGLRVGNVGTSASVRVWVSAGMDDQTEIDPGSVPGLRLGVGAYAEVHQQRVAGTHVPVVIESRGHTWHLSSVHSQSTGTSLRSATADVDRIAAVVWRTHGHTRASAGVTGQTPTGSSSPAGPGSLGDLWVPAGARVQASVTQGTGRLGVAFYERED